MAENIYLAVHFEGSPLKKMVSTYVSDEFGNPSSDWTMRWHPDKHSVTGPELAHKLEVATEFLYLLRQPNVDTPYDRLNGHLVRGVTELLSVPGYRLSNLDDELEVRHVDHTAGFTPVQSVGGDIGRLIVVAPLV